MAQIDDTLYCEPELISTRIQYQLNSLTCGNYTYKHSQEIGINSMVYLVPTTELDLPEPNRAIDWHENAKISLNISGPEI